MLGTIDDLEKDIERFRSNVAASGEMCELLEHMLEQIKQQNVSFVEQSDKLIKDIETLPTSIETANAESNAAVKRDITTEVDRLVQEVTRQQNQYVRQMDQTQHQIVDAMSETSGRVRSMEDQLLNKYQDFLQRLATTDLGVLIEQQKSLQDELNKRTTILMVISAISVVVGIVGLVI